MKKHSAAVFERHEKKYVLGPGQYRLLRPALEPFARPDSYGLHTICNVYYDTQDYALIRRSLDKPAFKQKLRLRSYGVPGQSDTVYLELKKKWDGVTYKRRIALPLCEAETYLDRGGTLTGPAQMTGEIDWFVRGQALAPRVVLCYDRVALCGTEDPDLRITFDSGIRWREQNLRLGGGDGGALLMPDGRRIMEIKTNTALPLALARLLGELEIYPSSFSKYGAAYRQLPAIKKEVIPYAG